ncbi:MAG: hypothetical protein DRN04_15390 [Thermoprotei archaeon]|nr:MAG: hypothetical protein DRN04_15390 [Thermoprotei archaeon]
MYIGKSIIGVFIALVMLASMGIAFAMWSETLRINVTVDTGEVDVIWGKYWSNDTIEKPEVSLDVTKVYITEEAYDDEGDLIKLNVTIDNAYPGYKVGIYGMVNNTGSIPVKLLSATLKYNDVETSLTLCQWVDLDLDGDGDLDLNVHLELAEDGEDGTQIDPGATDTYELVIHVKQGANETATYGFEVEFVFAQWNEVP